MSNFKVTFSKSDTKMASYREYEQRNVDSFGYGGGGRRGGRGRGGGSFKKGGNRRYKGGGGNQYGNRGPNPRSRFNDDDDVSMDDAAVSTSKDRFSPYGRQGKGGVSKPSRRAAMDDKGRANALSRLGLPVRSKKFTPGRIPDSESNWWRVTIPFGAKASKDFVLKSITDMSSVPFLPVEYGTHDNQATFYVQDRAAAAAIASCSKRITMPTGHKMLIIIRASHAPDLTLTGEVLDALKVIMSNRYDPPTKTLNLRDLVHDADLKQKNYHLPLYRTKVMGSIVKIIGDHIPELEALDLSFNKIGNLSSLEVLTEHAPNISRLTLSQNQIKNLRELEKLKKFPLVELSMDRNPCCDYYKDESSYIK